MDSWYLKWQTCTGWLYNAIESSNAVIGVCANYLAAKIEFKMETPTLSMGSAVFDKTTTAIFLSCENAISLLPPNLAPLCQYITSSPIKFMCHANPMSVSDRFKSLNWLACAQSCST